MEATSLCCSFRTRPRTLSNVLPRTEIGYYGKPLSLKYSRFGLQHEVSRLTFGSHTTLSLCSPHHCVTVDLCSRMSTQRYTQGGCSGTDAWRALCGLKSGLWTFMATTVFCHFIGHAGDTRHGSTMLGSIALVCDAR